MRYEGTSRPLLPKGHKTWNAIELSTLLGFYAHKYAICQAFYIIINPGFHYRVSTCTIGSQKAYYSIFCIDMVCIGQKETLSILNALQKQEERISLEDSEGLD